MGCHGLRTVGVYTTRVKICKCYQPMDQLTREGAKKKLFSSDSEVFAKKNHHHWSNAHGVGVVWWDILVWSRDATLWFGSWANTSRDRDITNSRQKRLFDWMEFEQVTRFDLTVFVSFKSRPKTASANFDSPPSQCDINISISLICLNTAFHREI